MSRNIRTLGELKGNKPDSGNDSDSEDRQGFFVGGSERSGQQVLGPNDSDRFAENLFESARRHGAEALNAEEQRGESSRAFASGSYRLSDSAPQPDAQAAEPRAERVDIIFWEDGFSIDDGPLRSLEDPASHAFLDDLKKGRVPSELQQKYRYKALDVRMQRRPTPYVKPKAKPFSTAGHRLGAPVPEVVNLEQPVPSSTADPEEAKKLVEQAQATVGLREGEPTGRIQIRPPSGERLIGVFNPSHTVEDVRSFVVTALPDLSFTPFALHTTFPNKRIDDESKTVKEADILNAVVVIKVE